MDGNNKIRGIVFTGVIALAVTACKVQAPGYVSLYVDNLISVNDSAAYTGESPLNMVDTSAVIKAELPDDLCPAIEIVKVSSDSAYQHEIKNLLKAITDSIQLLGYQIGELNKQLAVMPDTSFTGEKPQEFQQAESLQTEIDFKQLMQAKNDTIILLRNQVDELKKATGLKADTVYVTREAAASLEAENQQTDHLTLQLIKAKDDQIQILQNQLNEMQTESNRTPQQTQMNRESTQVQPLTSQQPDQLTLQLIQDQNDTIQLLKTQLLNMEKQILQGMDTSALVLKNEKDSLYTVVRDTILLVAFYERGEIKPFEEESLLTQVKELCRDKNLTKITLSGYTDSSGSEIVNKEITNRRLTYLSEMINPWVEKEKVFFQNFGDAYASDFVVSDQRRIEIRIYTK